MYSILIFISFILVLLIVMIFYCISFKKMLDIETFSSYECGFNMGFLSRNFFSLRFFLISILFLIFDVEIALLLCSPFLIFVLESSIIFFFFFFILVIGLLYEYYYGSLNWMNIISKA